MKRNRKRFKLSRMSFRRAFALKTCSRVEKARAPGRRPRKAMEEIAVVEKNFEIQFQVRFDSKHFR
jgi:hypothetical protein